MQNAAEHAEANPTISEKGRRVVRLNCTRGRPAPSARASRVVRRHAFPENVFIWQLKPNGCSNDILSCFTGKNTGEFLEYFCCFVHGFLRPSRHFESEEVPGEPRRPGNDVWTTG